MFLTAKETGGPKIFSLRQHNCYLAVWHHGLAVPTDIQAFDIERLAETLGQGLPADLRAGAGETWQEHRSLILLACAGGNLFEYLTPQKGEG